MSQTRFNFWELKLLSVIKILCKSGIACIPVHATAESANTHTASRGTHMAGWAIPVLIKKRSRTSIMAGWIRYIPNETSPKCRVRRAPKRGNFNLLMRKKSEKDMGIAEGLSVLKKNSYLAPVINSTQVSPTAVTNPETRKTITAWENFTWISLLRITYPATK